LAAYSEPTTRPCAESPRAKDSKTASVAPIAAVAGSKVTQGTPKATAACRAGEGSRPIQSSARRFARGIKVGEASTQSPMTASRAA
jgi:hypothetical protein